MGLNQALDISVSAIDAERKHMEIISSNIANINTTRTLDGGPYRRRIGIFWEKPITFEEALNQANFKISGGVEIKDIVEDPAPFQKVYNPSHPDADASGFVGLPNVSLSKEMVDMIYSSRLYEANIEVYNATKKMLQETMQIQ